MAEQEEEADDAPEDIESEELEAEEGAEGEESGEPEMLSEKGEAAFEKAFAEVDQDTDDDGGAPSDSLKTAQAKGGDKGDEKEPDEDAEGDEEPEAEEDDEDMALHRAYTTLHDAGVPAKVLKRTPRAELIAWAGSVGTKAGESDESASAGDKAANEAAAGAKGGVTPAQEKTADWAAMRKGLAEGLGIDEESADALKPLHDTIESLRAEVRELRASTDGATAEARAREGRATIDLHVQRLSGAGYPRLARDPKAREKLVEQASVLLKGGMKNAATIFDKAAVLAFGPPKRGDLAQLRRNGVSHPPTERGEHAGSEVSDEDDYFARALDYIDAGRKDLAANLKLPKQRTKAKRK